MEYQLICDDGYNFDNQINQLLKEGWKLHGATQVILDDKENCYSYHQAMTREEKDREDFEFRKSIEQQLKERE